MLFCRGSFGTLLDTHAFRSKTSGCFADTGSLASVYTWPHTPLLLLFFSLIMCCHVGYSFLPCKSHEDSCIIAHMFQRSKCMPLKKAEKMNLYTSITSGRIIGRRCVF